MRKFTFFILLLCALFSFDSQAAGGALDVSGTLARPGVKLVAVEFFATWCKPCMESVPKWKALHEKYRAKGLRLIVVSVGEDGMCTNPGWNPDQTVCDLEGEIQQSMGALKLPQAFLWSWQGNLLASHASHETVERAIETYFRETPRILISEPTDKNDKPVKDATAIREMVRSELRKQAKFDLVASGEDRRILRKLAKKGYDPRYDDSLQCEIGQEVSPNSELKVKLISWGKNKQTLLLQLYSIEKGCMVASAKTRVEGDMERAIYDAVLQLVRQLMGKASGAARGGQDMPPGGTTAGVEQPQDAGELSYDQLIQRAEKLKAEQAQLEVARQKRMKKLEEDWQKVQKIALETALPQKDRVKFVRQFLATYDSDNPHKDDAIKLIKDILEGRVSFPGDMVRIPAGSFMMGSPKSESGRDDDEAQHRVTISRDFLIGKLEVTVGEWNELMKNDRILISSCGDNCPVLQNWYGAVAYTNARSKQEGLEQCYTLSGCKSSAGVMECTNVSFKGLSCRGYRLPTEAEWEYAARAGTTTAFSTGQCLSTDDANYDGSNPQSGCPKGQRRQRSMKVGSFRANAWGLHDMHGNAYEWVTDWYRDYLLDNETDPMGPSSGSRRVIRGGSSYSSAHDCRSANRASHAPEFPFNSPGFRLARSLP